MFSSSVRRAALTAPQTPIVTSLTSTAARTTASHALSYRSHQRRFSSSKPSSPADGSKRVAQGQEVPSKPSRPADGSKSVAQGQEVPAEPLQTRPDSEKKSSRTSRRKAKDDVAWNLPSVPSTQHIPPNQISASSFFSLHRPISLHISFPKNITDDAFAAIFTPRTKTNKPAEVISTLSNTIENFDGEAVKVLGGSQQDQWNAETDELRAAITAESYRKAETQHLDTPPPDSAMNFSRHILSGRYQPFSPPPAPVPMNTAESLAAGAEAAEAHEPQHRTYTAVLTIEESTDEHGEVTYMAHSSPLMQKDPPAVPARYPFLERMNIRQERYRERAEENGIWAISVKRQRKLKMKKHKYKKLMRRTRNLRRRLDRN